LPFTTSNIAARLVCKADGTIVAPHFRRQPAKIFTPHSETFFSCNSKHLSQAPNLTYSGSFNTMFSVPGWSVSAPLKTQSEAPSKQPLQSNGQAQESPTAPPQQKAKDLKRKRSGSKSKVSEVTGSNVSALWETVIEGKVVEKKVGTASNATKRRRKNRDKQRLNGKDKIGADKVDDTATTEPSKTVPEVDQETKKKDKHSKTENIGAGKPQPPKTVAIASTEPKLTPLQASMRAKLSSARFRHLNEQLYTTPSATSLALFSDSPTMFAEYHAGFRQQVAVWPENPVDGYISDIRTRGTLKQPYNHRPPKKTNSSNESKEVAHLPRTRGTCIIADLGCGDAQLAQSLTASQDTRKLNLTVHSFDLHPANKSVTKADIAQLPLADGAVDIAIFCLALMGTNWLDFIDEAWRVLHWKGELWVAEIKSRFTRPSAKVPGAVVEHSVGNRQKKPQQKANKKKNKEAEEEDERVNDEALAVEVDGAASGLKPASTDVTAFINALRKRGFVLDGEESSDAVDMRNRMFVKLRFIKGATPIKGKNAAAAAAAAAEERQSGTAVEEDKTGGGQRGGQTWQRKTAKGMYLDREDDKEDEGKILKPCVYKLR
jgi:ribosomal RNA-processing protein 8